MIINNYEGKLSLVQKSIHLFMALRWRRGRLGDGISCFSSFSFWTQTKTNSFIHNCWIFLDVLQCLSKTRFYGKTKKINKSKSLLDDVHENLNCVATIAFHNQSKDNFHVLRRIVIIPTPQSFDCEICESVKQFSLINFAPPTAVSGISQRETCGEKKRFSESETPRCSSP